MPRPFHILDFCPDKESKYLNMKNCKIYAFFRIVKHVSHNENGNYNLIKRTTIYTEDTIDTKDIRRHKAKGNSYKHDL
jgi:putative ubiquitin-RnfH superfamily antitoxin RatB of RatAB toxin-antitoxin module